MKMIEPGILFFVNAFVFDRGLTARVRPANFRSCGTKDRWRILDFICSIDR
jgi:hypothetical protein